MCEPFAGSEEVNVVAAVIYDHLVGFDMTKHLSTPNGKKLQALGPLSKALPESPVSYKDEILDQASISEDAAESARGKQ